VQIPSRSATTLPPVTSAWMRIGELSRRTGVTPELLRAWERRYGLLRPRRTDGRTRLYSAADETRVRLMQRYIVEGLAPSEAAEMVTASRLTIRPGSAASIPAADVRLAHEAMHASLDRFDETSAQRALENLFATYSPLAVVRDVMVPYLREVGDRWAAGHVSVAQEHFATNFLHARLLAFARGWDRGLGPRAVLACAPGEQHTFGLVSFGVALHQLGWRITYLGADTSVAMIDEAAAHVEPDLVVVAGALPERLADIAGDLAGLGGRRATAIAGGGASASLAAAVGARHLDGDPVSAAHDLSVRR
jgi:MerR family transcriptional regulator, light-induced transcriptional regulator